MSVQGTSELDYIFTRGQREQEKPVALGRRNMVFSGKLFTRPQRPTPELHNNHKGNRVEGV